MLRHVGNLKKTLQESLAPLDSIESGYPIGHRDIVAHAALVRAIGFNIEAISNRRPDRHMLLMPNLRSICEDIIYLRALLPLEAKDANTIVRLINIEKIEAGLRKQQKFIHRHQPLQPTLADHISLKDALEADREDYRKIADKIGWNPKKLPPTRDLAERGGLIDLYDFFFHATSELVHFSPRILLRMGWGEPPNFKFNLANYSGYYRAFNIFYGAFLLRKLLACFQISDPKLFASMLPLDTALEKFLSAPRRFPEIVTYEEMNMPVPKRRSVMHLLRATAKAMMDQADLEDRR